MKSTVIALCLLFSFPGFTSESKIICNDQNSHTVLNLELNEVLTEAKLTAIQADSSVTAEGSNVLKIQEGESSEGWSTFSGRTNKGKSMAILFDVKKAATLKKFEILEVLVYFQPNRGDILKGQTTLLCSLN